MIPLNVTHTAILEHFYHSMLLSPHSMPAIDSRTLPTAQTPLRHTLSTLLSFFSDSYRTTFGFNLGPPLHDALTIAYLVNPDLFKGKRYRVDVEMSGTHSAGQTVVDVWNYTNPGDGWGVGGKNCFVTEGLEVSLILKWLIASFFSGWLT
jgi:uridine nucleosidase